MRTYNDIGIDSKLDGDLLAVTWMYWRNEREEFV